MASLSRAARKRQTRHERLLAEGQAILRQRQREWEEKTHPVLPKKCRKPRRKKRAEQPRAAKEKSKPLRERKRVTYAQYIRSAWWKERRLIAIQEAGGQCENCLSRLNLEVHHKNYKRRFRELAKDLQVLCNDCHDDLHLSKVLGVSVDAFLMK